MGASEPEKAPATRGKADDWTTSRSDLGVPEQSSPTLDPGRELVHMHSPPQASNHGARRIRHAEILRRSAVIPAFKCELFLLARLFFERQGPSSTRAKIYTGDQPGACGAPQRAGAAKPQGSRAAMSGVSGSRRDRLSPDRRDRTVQKSAGDFEPGTHIPPFTFATEIGVARRIWDALQMII